MQNSIKICRLKSGSFTMEDGNRYLIQPIENRIEKRSIDSVENPRLKKRGHVLFPDESFKENSDHFCASDSLESEFDVSQADGTPSSNSSGLFSTSPQMCNSQPLIQNDKYIELLLVSDYHRYLQFGKDTKQTLIESAHHMNLLAGNLDIFQHPDRLHVVLVGIVIFKTPTILPHVKDNVDADQVLKEFCSWRRKNLRNRNSPIPKNDVALFLLGRTIISDSPLVKGALSIEGYAPVKGMCDPYRSSGIVNGKAGPSIAYTATVMTHELGHSLSARHDHQFGHIMAKSSSKHRQPPTTWSEQSKCTIMQHLNDMKCLKNLPHLCGYVNLVF
jgi:hypothetical protein